MITDLVTGIDFGTDSVRALLVDALKGTEIAESVFDYPRWKQGMYCRPELNQFRQHPLDYIEGLEHIVKDVIKKAGSIEGLSAPAEKVRGIAVDTTGSTPAPVDKNGTPLAMLSEFSDDPDAMFILWKDHTALREAEEINKASKSGRDEDYTRFEGGVYSSEWFWAKILHTLRGNEKVRAAAWSWVEHSDWIPALLTGITGPGEMYRSRCAAGHKAMWHEDFNGLPPEEFFAGIDPLLSGLRERLYSRTDTAEKVVGHLSEEWAGRLGLSTDVVVGGSAFDAHIGAVGGGIKPFDMVKIVGTSTCDIIVTPPDVMEGKLVGGICGQVDGSVLPGAAGLEAGQSAFGDVYAWFRNLLMWPVEKFLTDENKKREISDKILSTLSDEASALPREEDPVALDWLNGRRTPWADQSLKGAITGLTLATDAPRFYRALVEATAFGSRKIMERFLEEGVEIKRVIAIGGVAKKSGYVMQVLSDVMNREILVAKSDQAVALGAAMFAAAAAGLYPDIDAAQEAMSSGFSNVYKPKPGAVEHYNKVYKKYEKMGELYGKIQPS
jgi:L-ribulokinase